MKRMILFSLFLSTFLNAETVGTTDTPIETTEATLSTHKHEYHNQEDPDLTALDETLQAYVYELTDSKHHSVTDQLEPDQFLAPDTYNYDDGNPNLDTGSENSDSDPSTDVI